MCFYLNRDVELREADFVIQPHLSWIVDTYDGLISEVSNNNDTTGILRIVCPRPLENSDIENNLAGIEKKERQEGHFTNCQLQMGVNYEYLCGVNFCDIAVFVFNGMIIMRIHFLKYI